MYIRELHDIQSPDFIHFLTEAVINTIFSPYCNNAKKITNN